MHKRTVRTAYGEYKPGDVVELPDDSVYDESVFEPVKPDKPVTDDKKKGDK